MSIDELLHQLLGADPQALTPIFRQWISESRRFRAFVEQYQRKIRAKLRTAGDGEALQDLLFELEIAQWLLREKRFTLAYESQGLRTAFGPDFTVTFTTKVQFYVEVTRIRATYTEEAGATAPSDLARSKLFYVILGKLGQLQADAGNLLLIGLEPTLFMDADADVDEIIKQMKARVETNDQSLLARAHLPTPSAFFKQYHALSGVLFYFTQAVATPTPVPPLLWLNKAAKYPLLPQIQTRLRQLAIKQILT
jgi:hypothetical protein